MKLIISDFLAPIASLLSPIAEFVLTLVGIVSILNKKGEE